MNFWCRVLGVIFLAFAAVSVPSFGRVQWGWLGLTLIAIAELPLP